MQYETAEVNKTPLAQITSSQVFLFARVYCVNFCMRQRKEPIPDRDWVASLFNRLKTQQA